MSDFDKDMQSALGGGQFDPDRARAAQVNVYDEYQNKLKKHERMMWLMVYLLCAAGAYGAAGFAVQATTTKGLIGYSMVFLFCMVTIIQKTILYGISAGQFVSMKEIKQLRLAMASGTAIHDSEAAKPLRGCSFREKFAWNGGLLAVAISACMIGTITNREADTWIIKAPGRVEAHNVLTIRRFPHEIYSFNGIKPPANGAVLKSATLNGKPVAFNSRATDLKTSQPLYAIQAPYRLNWLPDKLELVWEFSLPPMQDYRAYRAPLRSMIPVHSYALTLQVDDDSGFVARDDSWKFNKSPEELKNEAEARRTVKAFTGGGDAPHDDFGTCGLGIVPRQAQGR